MYQARELLDFLYWEPVGEAIVSSDPRVKNSPTTGKPRFLVKHDRILAVFREDGYLLLERNGLALLKGVSLTKKIVVDDVASQFILRGKDLFCKHIVSYTGEHWVGEDAIMVSRVSEILGCGMVVVRPSEAKFFKKGRAVKSRVGYGDGPHLS